MQSKVLFLSGIVIGAFTMFVFMSTATVGADGPSGNGDTNGDGRLDIADAICLLTHLFAGGPEPVVLECAECRLPATGQTACYDLFGEMDCDNPDFPGQDDLYQTGCLTEGRFIDNSDGTVTDRCTGLMWQQATAGSGAVTWSAALQYCENLEVAGWDDWRLANVRELQSIVDYGRWEPAIDPVFSVEPSSYWSSTTGFVLPSRAWVVSLGYGGILGADKGELLPVLAVRTIQPGE
jgi:hypothetical protein